MTKRKNYNELKNEGVQRLNIDVDSDLWHKVGIKCAEIKEEKKEFLSKALQERLERLNNE
jgi:Arc/MetJ family transcription regulator